MKIKVLEGEFAVCKVKDYSKVDFNEEICFIGQTDNEKSLVCREAAVPGNVIMCEKGWRGFRIEGILDFSMIGIIARISGVLASNGIVIFVVSTYNTDYVFAKKEDFERAVELIENI